MTVSRLKSEVQLDTAAFPPLCHDDVIALVSTEFTNDDSRFRQILILSGKNAKHPYSLLTAVTVPAGLLPAKEKQSFAGVTERGLEIVVGTRAYLVKGVVK
jgi:hypothetical protein